MQSLDALSYQSRWRQRDPGMKFAFWVVMMVLAMSLPPAGQAALLLCNVVFLFGEIVVGHLIQNFLGTLLSCASRQLRHAQEDALVFVRQERTWQTNEQPGHAYHDDQVQHQITTGTAQDVAYAIGVVMRALIEHAVKPTEEAGGGAMAAFLDGFQHRGAERRGQNQCHHACLRSGVGLLTVHAPLCNNDILQTSAPEAMVETDVSETCFAVPTDTDDYQAVGIGPGLGRSEETEAALIEQLEHCQTPTVVDADALNILANHRHTLTHLPKGSILTPHPKELERLVGKCQDSYERLMKACELAHTDKVHIILKGAYSAIITPEGKCYFNQTGNPGMATGGSGDVLTGVILALLAQGYPAEDAAKIGTYIHGLAGDIAQKKQGPTMFVCRMSGVSLP